MCLQFDAFGSLGFSGLIDETYTLGGQEFSVLTWVASAVTVNFVLVLSKLKLIWDTYNGDVVVSRPLHSKTWVRLIYSHHALDAAIQSPKNIRLLFGCIIMLAAAVLGVLAWVELS